MNRFRLKKNKIIVLVVLVAVLILTTVGCTQISGGKNPVIDADKEYLPAGNPHTHTYGEETPVGRVGEKYMFVQTCNECGYVRRNYYASLLTFIDDDGKTEALLHWERIIDATGIKMTCALIAGRIEDTTDYDFWASYAGWDLLDRLGEKGIEYVNHTYNHERLINFTEDQLHEDFTQAKQIFRKHNINSDILVYPFYKYDDTVVSVTSMYFEGAFAGHDEVVTTKNFDHYAIKRMNINDPENVKDIVFPDGRVIACKGVKSAEKLQQEMQKAISQNGWLVYVVHAYDSTVGKYHFDEESEQSVIDFCHWVQTQPDVKIVTATEGFIASQPIE